MLLTKEVEMLITSRNAKYYQNRGYAVPKKINKKTGLEVFDVGKKIVVSVKDLPDCSKVAVKYKCDCCGAIKEITFYDWKRKTDLEAGSYCKSCAVKIKLPEILEQKYGEFNVANIPVFIERKKQTNKEKYGNEWAIASDQVKQHIKHSFEQKFGVSNPMKSKEIQQKAKDTNNIKYGGNGPMCSKEVREKSMKTSLERYGVPNPYQNKDIQAKARKTLNDNGKVPSSKAEKRFVILLKEIFGEENCLPCYQEGELTFDCLLQINGQQIDVEYDGDYWHKNRKQKDAARNAVLMNRGYKILRVLANDKDDMPQKIQIKEAVDYLVKDNHHLVFINMNN